MSDTAPTNTFPEDRPFSLNAQRALTIARNRPANPVVR